MSTADIQVVKTVRGLESLAGDWNALSAPFATPVMDHNWSLAAACALHDEPDLRVVVVREQGRVTGVAPMVVDRRLGGRLGVIGASALYEPGGWLYGSEQSMTTLARAERELHVEELLRDRFDAVETFVINHR